MNSTLHDAHRIISLIYETAEDTELWPKLLEAYKDELESGIVSGEEAGEPLEEQTLASHLLRALRMNQRLENMQQEVGAAKNVLDCLPMAIVTVDSKCQLVSANRLAHKVVADSPVLTITRGRISCLQQEKALEQLVSSALKADNSDSNQNAIKLFDSKSQTSTSVFAVKTTGIEDSSQECCTLFIVSNALSDYVSPETLRNTYHLTPAESRLAHKLVSGDSLADIAEQLNISHNTARNQLKSIFSKTDTKRQAELVGLILSTPTNTQGGTKGNDKQERQHRHTSAMQHIVLSDGRQMPYLEFGDPKGKPLIYFHEFVAWPWWQHFPKEEFHALGVRVLVPLRPGFHGATWKHKVSLPQWSEDFAEWIDALGLETFHLLGFSAGGSFALICAHHFPQRCQGLSLVSSAAQVESMSDYEDVKPALSKLMIGFAKYTPRVYRSFIGAILKTASANTLGYVRGYTRHWSEYDRNLCADLEIAQSLGDALKQTLAIDASGIVNECVVFTSDWGINLEQISVPTQIWRGEEDKALPRKLADKLSLIPNSDTHIVPAAGHLLIFDYWREIISALMQIQENEAVMEDSALV